MDKEKYGVHISHCCYIHGCKYGDEDCPVVSGEVAQKYLCYDCSEEYEPYTLEEIEQLRKTKSYRPTYEQLKDKVADLEAKLAEKENEYNNKCIYEAKFRKTLGNWQNQTAIEELEKVKETLIQNADEIGEEYKEDYFMISLGNIKRIIDQQIKSLKGGINNE